MKLEDIGFYTLSDYRAMTASYKSCLSRCEILLTKRCNFHCTYCRGANYLKRDMPSSDVIKILDLLFDENMQNVRFTGGEPTLLGGKLINYVQYCASNFCKHIAISTNGSADLDYYHLLISHGVNDLSISLDACCGSVGDKMSHTKGYWHKVVENIKELSKETYVTVGMVFTEDNVNDALKSVEFVHSLGVADIRVIPAAQYDKALLSLNNLANEILNAHPILKYRIGNIRNNRRLRGLNGLTKCPLVLDDMAIAGNYHYPCIIYMREYGSPIGEMTANFREQRLAWYQKTDVSKDSICSQNCLDVCVDYNNRFLEINREDT